MSTKNNRSEVGSEGCDNNGPQTPSPAGNGQSNATNGEISAWTNLNPAENHECISDIMNLFFFFICCFPMLFLHSLWHPSEVCTPTSMLMPHKFHSFSCGFIVHSLRHQQGSTYACFADSVVAVGREVVSFFPCLPPLPFLKKILWILHHMSFALHCALPKRWMMAMMKTPIWCGLWLKPGSWIQSLLLATTSTYTFIIQNRKLMYHIIS